MPIPFLIPLLMAAGGAGIGALSSKKGERLNGALKGAAVGGSAGLGLGGLGAAAGGASAAGTAGTAATGGKFAAMLSKAAPYVQQYAMNRLQNINGGGQEQASMGQMPIMSMGGSLPAIQNIQAQQAQPAMYQANEPFGGSDSKFLRTLLQQRYR